MAQWVQTSGPEAGSVSALFRDGASMFAGTYGGGVFRSSNNGSNWVESSNGIQYTSVEEIKKSGSFLLATGTVSVYRSSDNGATWTPTTGLPTGNGVRRLAVDGSTVYAATAGKGIYKSTDNGAAWFVSSTGLPNAFSYTYCGDVIINGSTILCSSTDNSTAGIFRSTDAGATWTNTNSSIMGFSAANVLRIDGANIYAGGSKVWKSTDGGLNWSVLGTGIPENSGVSDILVDGTTIYAAAKGIYRSTNNGLNWNLPDTVTLTSYIYRLLKDASVLYAGSGGRGVFKSTDNAVTWASTNTGLRAARNSLLLSNGSNVFAAGSGVYVTSNDGATWQNSDAGISMNFLDASVFQQHNGKFFLGAEKLYRSTDNGTSWSLPVSGMPAFGVTSLTGTSNVLFAAAGSLHKSTDEGLNWSPVSPGWFPYCLANTGSSILAGTNNGIFRTTNEGAAWNPTTGLPSFTGIGLFAVVGTTIFAARDFSKEIYKSTDDGISWSVLPNIPGVSNPTSYFLPYGSILFASFDNNGIFVTQNLGSGWTKISTGLPQAVVYSLAIANGYLFVGTEGNSVWRRPLSQITAVDNGGNSLSRQFSLEQNYPNPFNPSTQIQYQVSSNSHVSLKVFDVLGEEVTALVDELKEKGIYEIEFESKGLASGVYYYKLSSGNFTQTKKMILIR